MLIWRIRSNIMHICTKCLIVNEHCLLVLDFSTVSLGFIQQTCLGLITWHYLVLLLRFYFFTILTFFSISRVRMCFHTSKNITVNRIPKHYFTSEFEYLSLLINNNLIPEINQKRSEQSTSTNFSTHPFTSCRVKKINEQSE